MREEMIASQKRCSEGPSEEGALSLHWGWSQSQQGEKQGSAVMGETHLMQQKVFTTLACSLSVLREKQACCLEQGKLKR